MSFMEIETHPGPFFAIDGRDGTTYVPADVIGEDTDPKDLDAFADYYDGREVESVELVRQAGARYTAPGYLDCTPWTVADTEEEAAEEARGMYGDDEEGEGEEGD